MRENHPILRTLRSGKAGLNRPQIEREQFRIFRFGRFLVVKESLLAAVSLNQSNLLRTAPAELQILQTFFVDGEDAAGRAVLRRHVGDGSAVGQRQIAQSGSEVLDKFSHDSMLAQHLGNRQNQIGSSRAFAQTPSKLHADNKRNQHGNRLPQHRSLSLNAAHTPSQHA